MEEVFFCMYKYRMSRDEALAIPPHERQWLINRYIQQKEKENEAIERERKKGRSKK